MYADDVTIMAENKKRMKGLMARLKQYSEEKGVKINTSQTKIIRCKKGKGEKRR